MSIPLLAALLSLVFLFSLYSMLFNYSGGFMVMNPNFVNCYTSLLANL